MAENSKEKETGEVNFEEDILSVISPMGLFQVRVTIWGLLQDAVNSICVMFFLFGGVNPGFSCIEQREELNATHQPHLLYNSVCIENLTCFSRLYKTDDLNSIISEVSRFYLVELHNEYNISRKNADFFPLKHRVRNLDARRELIK